MQQWTCEVLISMVVYSVSWKTLQVSYMIKTPDITATNCTQIASSLHTRFETATWVALEKVWQKLHKNHVHV